MLLLDLHTDFSRGRSDGLVILSLSEFSTVCCDAHKSFSIVSEAEVDVFLELPCFLHDPTNVGDLISSSYIFSKPSLYSWKFSFHVVLTSSLKDFEHNLAST